jgi:antitoxin (DNA-binding transcriptional repressor) of toxin-antitoxin stability system
MAVMTVSEARAALPEVLNRVEAGEQVTITRHGRAVAVVVRPDIMGHLSQADDLTAQAEQLQRIIKMAGEQAMPSGGLSIEYAEELVAEIRAGRDSR